MEQYEIIKLDSGDGEINASTSFVYSYRMHAHTYYEMTLYEPFDGSVTVNGKEFKMDSYTCIIVAPSDLHQIDARATDNARFIKLQIPPDTLHDKPDFSMVLQKIDRDGFLPALFYEILKTQGEAAYVRNLVNAAICKLSEIGSPIRPVKHGAGHQIVAEALRIVHKDFLSPITQRDVASRLSVTPQYLSRVFHDTLHIGFPEYLSDLRLDYAFKLLKETDESVTTVCFACGYGNLSHFLRSFKKKYGHSPNQLRHNRDHRT